MNSNNLTSEIPTSVVIKLISTVATPAASANVGLGLPASNGCLNSAALVTATPGVNGLATGMAAWGTTLHALPVTPGSPATTYGETETPFTPSTLSSVELSRLTQLCGAIQSNASGFGICAGCSVGGLGAAAGK